MNPKTLLLAAVACSAMAVCSCRQDGTVSSEPSLTAVTQGDILAPYTGGEYSYEYSLVNPPEGGTLKVSLPDTADWISGIDTRTEGIVRFSISTNYNSWQRYTVMTISYAQMTLSFSVVQEAYEISSSEIPFTITVRDITSSSAKAEIVPTDENMTYVALNSPKTYVDGFDSDDDLFAAIIEHYRTQGESVGMTLEELFTQSGNLVSGPTVKEMVYLPSDMEQYVYAVGCSLSGQRLSSIVKQPFSTLAVDKTDRDFRIWYDINGPDVTMWAEPVPADDTEWYFFDLFSKEEMEAAGMTSEQILQSFIDQNISLGLAVGVTPDVILEQLLSVGRDSYFYYLDAETDYIGAACGVDADGKVNSEPVEEPFTTGKVQPSDNILSVQIGQVNLNWVEVSVTTTNSDPYVVIVTPASEYEGMSDGQIMDVLLERDLNSLVLNGDYKGNITGLTSETEYYLFAFGYRSGQATTEPVKLTFSTLGEADPSLLTFKFTVTDVTSTTARITVSGTPASAPYYWGVCPASWTVDDIKDSLEEKLQDNWPFVTDMADLLRQYGSRGTVDYGLYIWLDSDTDYVIYAFGFYEETGEWATDVCYSDIFHTLK